MLSPLDAKNLQYLYQSGDETISKIRMTQDGNGGFKDLCSHIYLGNPETQDNQLIAPSIDNLIRLKLMLIMKHSKIMMLYMKSIEIILCYCNISKKMKKIDELIKMH